MTDWQLVWDGRADRTEQLAIADDLVPAAAYQTRFRFRANLAINVDEAVVALDQTLGMMGGVPSTTPSFQSQRVTLRTIYSIRDTVQWEVAVRFTLVDLNYSGAFALATWYCDSVDTILYGPGRATDLPDNGIDWQGGTLGRARQLDRFHPVAVCLESQGESGWTFLDDRYEDVVVGTTTVVLDESAGVLPGNDVVGLWGYILPPVMAETLTSGVMDVTFHGLSVPVGGRWAFIEIRTVPRTAASGALATLPEGVGVDRWRPRIKAAAHGVGGYVQQVVDGGSGPVQQTWYQVGGDMQRVARAVGNVAGGAEAGESEQRQELWRWRGVAEWTGSSLLLADGLLEIVDNSEGALRSYIDNAAVDGEDAAVIHIGRYGRQGWAAIPGAEDALVLRGRLAERLKRFAGVVRVATVARDSGQTYDSEVVITPPASSLQLWRTAGGHTAIAYNAASNVAYISADELIAAGIGPPPIDVNATLTIVVELDEQGAYRVERCSPATAREWAESFVPLLNLGQSSGVQVVRLEHAIEVASMERGAFFALLASKEVERKWRWQQFFWDYAHSTAELSVLTQFQSVLGGVSIEGGGAIRLLPIFGGSSRVADQSPSAANPMRAALVGAVDPRALLRALPVLGGGDGGRLRCPYDGTVLLPHHGEDGRGGTVELWDSDARLAILQCPTCGRFYNGRQVWTDNESVVQAVGSGPAPTIVAEDVVIELARGSGLQLDVSLLPRCHVALRDDVEDNLDTAVSLRMTDGCIETDDEWPVSAIEPQRIGGGRVSGQLRGRVVRHGHTYKVLLEDADVLWMLPETNRAVWYILPHEADAARSQWFWHGNRLWQLLTSSRCVAARVFDIVGMDIIGCRRWLLFGDPPAAWTEDSQLEWVPAFLLREQTNSGAVQYRLGRNAAYAASPYGYALDADTVVAWDDSSEQWVYYEISTQYSSETSIPLYLPHVSEHRDIWTAVATNATISGPAHAPLISFGIELRWKNEAGLRVALPWCRLTQLTEWSDGEALRVAMQGGSVQYTNLEGEPRRKIAVWRQGYTASADIVLRCHGDYIAAGPFVAECVYNGGQWVWQMPYIQEVSES